MAVVMDKEQIKEIIPHRDPFLLIDEINELEVGQRVVATKYIKEDDFWFKGHFPDYPVTPGVVMLAMHAPAGAVARLSLAENKGKQRDRSDKADRNYRGNNTADNQIKSADYKQK